MSCTAKHLTINGQIFAVDGFLFVDKDQTQFVRVEDFLVHAADIEEHAKI